MKKKSKKITIINTVPINGGDEALLCATISGLNMYFDDPIINVLCNNPLLYKQYIDYVPLDWDWEYAINTKDANENLLLFRIKQLARTILKDIFNLSFSTKYSRLFSSKREKRVYKILNESNFIILGAGGYIHDYYGYEMRLKTLEFIREEIKKPYYFFGQSIGPFWEEKNYSLLQKVFNGAEKIILRERISLNHLKSIKYHCLNVFVNNDIAFYLYYNLAIEVNVKKKLRKIAINFREWAFEEEGKFIEYKGKKLCKNLISKGYELTFISTCQGVAGYGDDSIIAQKIVGLLTPEEQRHCSILNEKYTLEQFFEILSKQDAYIGMRLHGAIMSILAGIPALNIAYEDKTLGIYELLGIKDYCFSFKEDIEIWNSKVNKFILDYPTYLLSVESIRKYAAESAKNNFELLVI